MRRERWWLPLLALIFAISWKPTLTLPLPDEEVDTSTKLLGSSVVTSVSVVTGPSENGPGSASSNADRSRVIPTNELPGSPADLLRPDRFQFLDFNKDGVVVTKQMSEQQIHSLIAAGGGHLPMEIHEPQSAGDVPNGGMKVADVVQNVQNVLKGELNKPATVMTSMPTIPGHANTEWSSILPAILGGESESAPVSDPGSAQSTHIDETSVMADTTLVKIPEPSGAQKPATKLPVKEQSTTPDYETKNKPGMTEAEAHIEKPMIQVPVITVDQKLPAHQEEEDSTPVFQMLNTISPEKIKTTNSTQANDKPEVVKPQKEDHPDDEKIIKPENPIIKPVVQGPSVESSNVDEKAPEMVEINLSQKTPTEKPDSMIKPTETLSEVPQTEAPALVSVISETHSTSMKVTGHEEVPMIEPSKPQVTNPIKLQSEEKKPMEKPMTNDSTDVELDSTTTVKTGSSVTSSQVSDTVSTEKPGLIAQGVSFFGNLPQTVSSLVTDFISNNSPNSKPIVEEADVKTPAKTPEKLDNISGTKDSVKKPENTETSVGQTTPESIQATSKKPDQEPVYQMIPEIIPNKRVPPHGASPSEASSIEHIIETLNDPTGSISGTVASEHYGAPDPSKPVTVSDIQTSTAATPVNMETPAESSSAKPMEPLPTELADSLSSMISQISDARPSVLPVSEDAGLDTNEKKNASDMQAEEPTDETSKNGTVEVTKASEEPANKTELHLEGEANKSEVVPTKLPEIQDPTVNSVKPSTTTEKLMESSTTEAVKLDEPTTAKSDLPLTEKIATPADKIETEILAETTSLANPENVKPEAEPVLASSDIATDKIVPAVSTDASVVIKDSTESVIIQEKVEEKVTEKSATTVASVDSIVTTVSSDATEKPLEVEAVVEAAEAPMASKPEGQQSDAPIKIVSIENNTEMPIVHIDITEAKPTDFITNSSTDQDQDNGTESPLVRIQLTDPITMINNMINTASMNASATSVVPLTLPETGSVSPNSIASGLIAGFPSSTQATLEKKPTTPNSVKSQPEIQPVIDDSANSTKTSDVQVENITKSATADATESFAESNATEKVQVLESSTVKDIVTGGPEIMGQSTDLSLESAATKKPEEETTIQADLTQQATTDQPKKEESSQQTVSNENAEVSSSPMTEETVSNDQNSTKSSENVTVALEETTTAESEASNAGLASANGSKASESTISEQLDSGDKLNSSDASKIIETVVSSSAKPETPASQTDSSEIKIENVAPEKSGETNSTVAEIPVVRIDVAPETAPEEMPSKIQLDDLPIVETTVASIKPTEDEKLEAQSSESASTLTPLKSNSNDSTEATTSNFTEKTPLEIVKDTPKFEDATKEPTTESSTVPASSEKTIEASTIIAAPQQIEEVRIQVNDTAVRVTKRPVSEAPGQMSGDTQKTENQPIDQQSTTPKIDSITEGLVAKLPDKTEHLPVPIKVSELSVSQDGVDSLNNSNKANSSGTETRIRLGEEQGTKESTTMKAEDPRKPIKKNSDSDASQSFESNVTHMETTTTISSAVNDENSAKDSNAQPSITVELATNKTPTPSKINASSKLEDKPVKSNDKKPSARPISKPRPAHKPTMNIKKDDVATEDKWTLIPQQVYPAAPKPSGSHKRPTSTEEPSVNVDQSEQKISSNQRPPVPLDHPQSASGLDSTVSNLETDISYFANLCNELAFTFWTATNKGLSTSRSLAVSPFGMTSMLAMVFLGARGPTSDQMNDILRLDDVSSFNPHLVFQNVTDAVGLARNQGIANAAFVRELFADRSKVRKLMPFYKEQAQQFYDGIVAEVNFATISDLVRRRTNLMIRKQTGGRIKDFVRTNTVPLRSPLAAMSANVFQTDCNSSAASSEGRDGELYFAVSPAVRQRKLVPVPATVWRAGVLAGYEPSLDATAIALGGIDKLVSTIFVIPGQQGHTAPGDTLDQLEQRFITGATHDGAWNKLLKVLIPRPGLELQVPKFSHRSVINATAALKRMGLEELFSKHADLKGINGLNTDLHLADVLQMNLFSTCGDENILSGRHHVEVYPGSPLRNAREHHETEDKDEFLNDLADDDTAFSGSATPYEAAPHREARLARQTEGTEKPRLKLDRPFLYFVRHNPTGLILHMGRFNPRLLP